MTLYFMSDRELTRLEVLRDLTSGRLTVAAASELLGLERRQVLRLSKAYQQQGATALISKKRGRTSNRAAPAELKAQALDLVRQKYADFGPTLAAEKLREVHSIYVGRETLRTWMLEAGVWSDRQKRRGRVYQPRYRRDCVGELIQVDGSDLWRDKLDERRATIRMRIVSRSGMIIVAARHERKSFHLSARRSG